MIATSKKKVFCKNCGNVRSSSDCMGGTYVNCKAAPVKSQKDTPVRVSTTVFTPEELNKNNDCALHRPRRFWEVLWANTLG